MPLFSITAKFSATDDNKCRVQLTSGRGIPVRAMRLKMYSVHVERDGSSAVPNYLLVDLEGLLASTQIHNALFLTSGSQDIFHNHGHLSLPIVGTDTIQETNILLTPAKHIPKIITVKVFQYDATGNVIEFPRTGAGKTSIRNVQLWFEYDNPNIF